MQIKPVFQSIWKTMSGLSTTEQIAASMILKDVVGCVMYTNTAKANKRYTPEKRAEVANYDLANGIINIGLQLIAIKPVEHFVENLAKNKLVKHFFKDYPKRIISKDFEFSKTTKGWIKGFTALFSVVFSQYFIKRFVSPYFSMPVGEKFQQLGLVKPKLYPGESYGKDSLLDKFIFIRMFDDSQQSKKTKSFSGYFKQSKNNNK